MDPVTGAALIGMGSSVIGGLMGNSAQQQANAANREIAQQQMAFQERMSSTAHQREVADLKAAGLNPILSAGGSGASAPSGASATMQPVNAMSDAVKSTAGTAMQALSLKKELEQKDADIALTKQQETTAKSQRQLNDYSALKVASEGNKAQAEAQIANIQKDQMQLAQREGILDQKRKTDLEQSKADREAAKTKSLTEKFNQKANTFDNINNRMQSAFGTVNSALKIVKP